MSGIASNFSQVDLALIKHLSRYTRSDLTPGITRRPAPFAEQESRRVGGRVHAVVRRGVIQNARSEYPTPW